MVASPDRTAPGMMTTGTMSLAYPERIPKARLEATLLNRQLDDTLFDARELTTYEEAWTRRLPYLENIPTRYFAGLASILEREHAPGEEPRRDAAAAERRRRLQGEKMTGDLEAPGIILLIVFVPMLFIILWYAQGCCRPKQVVPT